MKKILLITTLLLTSLFAEIKWVEYDDAIIKAKQENKIIMVMLSQDGCPACEYMRDIVFEDEKLIEAFNKDFIGVYLDIYKGFIPDDLTHFGTPTFHFLNSFERKLDRIDGGKNVKNFMEKLEEIKANR